MVQMKPIQQNPFQNHPLERELRHALAVVREGGEILKKNFGHPPGIRTKEDGTRSCDMDITIADLVIGRFQRAFPDHGFVEEEYLRDDRGKKTYTWTIDPLDSTEHYIRGDNHHYGILLSLLKLPDYRPLLGAVYKPHFDELCYALDGRGTWQEIEKGNPQRIFVAETDEIFLIVSKSRQVDEIQHFAEQLHPQTTIHRAGSAKFLEIARGRAGEQVVTVGYQPPRNITHIWDNVPLDIIVREAGGYFRTANGVEMDYSKQGVFVNQEGILVTNTERMLHLAKEAHRKASTHPAEP